MTTTQILGAIIVFLPFVGLFILMAKEIGIGAAASVWAVSLATTSVIILGAYLLAGGAG